MPIKFVSKAQSILKLTSPNVVKMVEPLDEHPTSLLPYQVEVKRFLRLDRSSPQAGYWIQQDSTGVSGKDHGLGYYVPHLGLHT